MDDFKAAGASRVVALVKETVGTEVEEFHKNFWPGEILVDKEIQFYKALGGGEPHKPFSGVCAFLAMLANPWSTSRTKQHLQKMKEKGVANNMVGEGFVTGGCYVIRPDGTPAFSFLEEEIGDHAEVTQIIAALKGIAGSE